MASTITLYIARHGKTKFNTLEKVQGWCDSPLTDAGVEVAQHLGKGLNDVTFDAVYVSDLPRTHQTAQVLLEQQGQTELVAQEIKGLKETCFGRYESGSNHVLWSDIATHLGFPSPEELTAALFDGRTSNKNILDAVKALDTLGTAEDFDTVEKRTHEALNKIVKNAGTDANKNVLVVSHGMAIRVMLRAFGGEKMLKHYLDNASVSKLLYSDGKFTLESIGDMSYVEKGRTM